MRSFFSKLKRYSGEITIAGIVIVVLHNIMFFYTFSQQSARLTEEANKTQLAEIAYQTANNIKTMTDGMSDYINCAAESFSEYEDLLSEHSLEKLRAVNEKSRFDRIRIVLDDYVSYGPDGTEADVAPRLFLEEAFRGRSGVSGVIKSVITEADIISFYAPIYSGEHVTGVLTGAYEVESISAAVNITSFGGYGFASIMESDGNMIITPLDENLPESGLHNAWTFFEDIELAEGFSLQALKEDVQNGESGILEYTVSGEKKYTFYTPSGVNDWYVLQTVPETVLITQTDYINDISIELMLKVVGLFAFVVVIVLFFSYTSRKSITSTKMQLDNIVNAVPGGVVKCSGNPDYDFEYISDGFLELIGCTREELESGTTGGLLDSVFVEDKDRVLRQLEKQKEDTEIQLEYRIKTLSGETIWILNKCLRTVDKSDDQPRLYCVCIDITSNKRVQQTLQLSNERFNMAMSQTSNIVFEYESMSGKIHFVTKTSSYYNLPPTLENGPDYFVKHGIVDDQFTDHFVACFKSISKPETTMVSLILKLKRADGKRVWNRLTISSINEPAFGMVRSIGTFEDITQAKEAMLRHKREEKYRAAMLADAIITYEINLSSDRYIKIISTEHRFDYYTRNYSEVLPSLCDSTIYPEDREMFLNTYHRDNLIKQFEKGRPVLYNEYRHLDKNGQAFWVSCTTNLLSDPENGDIKAISYIKDIDEQKRKELAIKRNSERDSLTELYNRKAAQNLITDYLRVSDPKTIKNAFISIDLDGFKIVNDRYGHLTGDNLLSKVSACLSSVFRGTDIVARMGGDEFVVFMKDIRDRTDVMLKATAACIALKRLYVDENNEQCISASMGIALYPTHGDSFEELYRASDKALYRAKNLGKDRCVFYDPDTDT